ncbi:GNAT family N-acetyltransferase [Rubripirellula sp.]|nr:GNAT family N-acetyltransferase [Rubripirellula sp.]
MQQPRWELVGESGSYANLKVRDFIFDMAKAFLNQGPLHLNLMQHEGRNLAAELCLIGGNRVTYCYSAGYGIEAADLEPGRLANVGTLQVLYRSDLAGIDFMRGYETYKSRLSTTSRRVLWMRATAPNLIPRLRRAAWCTGFEVKQRMQKTAEHRSNARFWFAAGRCYSGGQCRRLSGQGCSQLPADPLHFTAPSNHWRLETMVHAPVRPLARASFIANKAELLNRWLASSSPIGSKQRVLLR